MEEEDTGNKIEIAGIPNTKGGEWTFTWLNSTSQETPQLGTDLTKQKTLSKCPKSRLQNRVLLLLSSATAITRVLLECMNKTATFNNLENAKLREFADLCADMESQMSPNLPGLACLIFPNAIQLIPERLPLLLCQKWEKEISKHTECLAFHAKSLDEGTEWLLAAGLCYCCLSKGHTASDCKENIECSICKDKVMQLSFTEREQGPLPKVEKPLTQNADRCVML